MKIKTYEEACKKLKQQPLDFTNIYFKTKNPEIIAGFNNMYIALEFYESFVEKAYHNNWDKRWCIQLIETETDKIISHENN